jgi:hypothetical protein
MNELMMFMSAALPEDFVLDELQKAITEYRATGEGKSKISMFCSLILSKNITDEQGFEKAMQGIDRVKKAMDLMDIKES